MADPAITLKHIRDRCRIVDDCWIWAQCTVGRYGRVRVGARTYYAHRLAQEIHTGKPIPRGMDVRRCPDHERCVNPEHTQIGSRKATVKAMRERGSLSAGVRHSISVTVPRRARAVLTLEKVREIRRLWVEGKKPREIAPIFGVDVTNVRKIVRGDAWRDGVWHG